MIVQTRIEEIKSGVSGSSSQQELKAVTRRVIQSSQKERGGQKAYT